MNITTKQIKLLIKEELDKLAEGACITPDAPKYAPEPNAHNREGSMARSQLFKAAKYAAALTQMFEDEADLPEWVESKITRAADYLGMVKHYLEGEIARDSGMLEERESDEV